MTPAPHVSVRDAPPKPLLIFDGNCHFCRRWIERWRELTAGAVEYAPSQEVAGRFPEIPAEAFDRSVQFVETDGTVYSGAEAVFRSLGQKRGRKWMTWSYEHLPGFAAVTEAAYRLVARHRRTASFFTRLLWGNDVRQPTYFESRRWFLRSLGGIYLIAFLSLWMQVDGLIGEHGILPVADYLPAARALRRQGSVPSADALLAQLERCFPAFSLRRRRRHFGFADCRLPAGRLAGSALRFLPVAHDRGPDVPEFSMGHPAARDRFSRHLLRAGSLANRR